MHGRVKVRTTAEQEAIKKKERAEKVVKYKAGISLIFQKREDKLWDEELLIVAEKMLLQNPDIYTLWNIRREAFLNNDWPSEKNKELLTKELVLTENCLRENPKSYSVWHQRLWVVNQIPDYNWNKELELCEKFLKFDERNFHCWDYRRVIREKAEISNAMEFEFSTERILNNFSNYSSWHYRSWILSKMFLTKELPDPEEVYKNELNIVMDATFTDPGDSSAWFYQRWLLNSLSTSLLFRVLLKKNVAMAIFETDVLGSSLSLKINSRPVERSWVTKQSEKGSNASKLWILQLLPDDVTDAREITFKFNDTEYSLECLSRDKGQTWLFEARNKRETEKDQDVLTKQLKFYKQLENMEPTNKWALLTKVILMKYIDPNKFFDEITNGFEKLEAIDPLRSSYYQDSRKKFLMESKILQAWSDAVISGKVWHVNLSDMEAFAIYGNQLLAPFQQINLNQNELGDSLHLLWTLQSCESLSLSDNNLKSLKNFPILRDLRILDLKDNQFDNIDEIRDVARKLSNLKEIDIRGNPLCQNSLVESMIQDAQNFTCTILFK